MSPGERSEALVVRLRTASTSTLAVTRIPPRSTADAVLTSFRQLGEVVPFCRLDEELVVLFTARFSRRG